MDVELKTKVYKAYLNGYARAASGDEVSSVITTVEEAAAQAIGVRDAMNEFGVIRRLHEVVPLVEMLFDSSLAKDAA